MSEDRADQLDRLLSREFSRAFEAVSDDGFTDRVVRRLRRRARLRALTLGSATLAGLAVAFIPIMQVVGALSGLAPMLTDGWRLEDLPDQYGYVAVAVLLGLASPLAIRLLER